MTEEDIRKKIKNKEYIGWSRISICQKLSEDFIREFSDKVDWYHISWYQKLSEEFIREFSYNINLKYIALCYFNIKNKHSWKNFI